MPSRNDANDWPRLPGAAAELSSGPRVQVASKLNWPGLVVGEEVARLAILPELDAAS